MRQLSRHAAVGLELLVLPARIGGKDSRLSCRIFPDAKRPGKQVIKQFLVIMSNLKVIDKLFCFIIIFLTL